MWEVTFPVCQWIGAALEINKTEFWNSQFCYLDESMCLLHLTFFFFQRAVCSWKQTWVWRHDGTPQASCSSVWSKRSFTADLTSSGKTILARQCNRHSWNLWRDVCPSDNHEGSEAVREWIFVVISILCGSVIDLCMDVCGLHTKSLFYKEGSIVKRLVMP